MKTIPKIKGYVASKKNRIVFLYRQSNKVTYLAVLDYAQGKEAITIGSRFYGKIYPNRCDLSADGAYFLYFAMGSSQQQYQKQLYCWTGICRPPNIKAELLFAHGDTWGGGGRFVDEQTIFVDPGMEPDFDKEKAYELAQFQITFKGSKESWHFGKGWKLITTQINPDYGAKYPIPKTWTKTQGNLTLVKHLNYTTFLKNKDGHTLGEYDLHHYELKTKNSNLTHPLNTEESICLWADFDNYGRLVLARSEQVFIYRNLQDFLQNKPHTVFNFETLLASQRIKN